MSTNNDDNLDVSEQMHPPNSSDAENSTILVNNKKNTVTSGVPGMIL
jgi:hypothetical protein